MKQFVYIAFATIECCDTDNSRFSALIPIPTSEHSPNPNAKPHTQEWVTKFEEAKFFIEQGIAYVPLWWTEARQNTYKAELEKAGMIYVMGTLG